MSSEQHPKGVFSALPELLLVICTIAALILQNSAASHSYQTWLHFPFMLSVQEWVNDGLMVVFFFLIGLEVKREFVVGHLSTRATIIVPLAGALGGMIVPALVFYAFASQVVAVSGSNGAPIQPWRGWAIPSATDIAFALGVLRIVARKVPASLRIFLSALAIADDLGAIVLIAIFYSSTIQLPLIALAALLIAIALWMGRANKLSTIWILVIGIPLWLCVLHSGVHATVAGVALAFCIPASTSPNSLMIKLEHALIPTVSYAILPIFALCNAGIPLTGMTLSTLTAPITLGTMLGLFFGKQIGVWLGAHIPIWIGMGAKLPANATPKQFYGVCVLTGIGFTMSLFIAALSYPADSVLSVEARLGVMLGSLLSVAWGAIVLNSVSNDTKLK